MINVKPHVGARFNPAHPYARGLVAFYLFNEGGGTLVQNAAGSGSGTLTNGPTWTRRGKWGTTLSFDGSNDYITLGTPPVLNFNTTQGMTVAASYRLAATPPSIEFQLAARDDSSGGRAWTFDLSSSQGLRFYLNGGGGSDLIAEGAGASSGQDRVVAGTYRTSDRRIRVWANGLVLNSATATSTAVPSATTFTTIGRRTFPSFEGYFNGFIDWVALWNCDASDFLPDFMRDPFAMFPSPVARIPLYAPPAAPSADAAPWLMDFDLAGGFSTLGMSPC